MSAGSVSPFLIDAVGGPGGWVSRGPNTPVVSRSSLRVRHRSAGGSHAAAATRSAAGLRAWFAGSQSGSLPSALLAIRLARAAGRNRGVTIVAARWAVRVARRVGARNLLSGRVRPLTFVMHSFMDARDVTPAWELLRRGELSDDPRIRATQERLQACAYAMAHPDSDELVPACAQHSVLDPLENVALRKRLPLVAHKPLDDHGTEVEAAEAADGGAVFGARVR